jgi:hypothetical protein
MSAPSIAHAAARPAALNLRAMAVAVLACTALAACAVPQATPGAADTGARAPAADYRPVLSGYTSARPVEPGDWRTKNTNVAPKAGRP